MLCTAPVWGLLTPLSFVFDLLNCKKRETNRKRNILVPSCQNIKQSNKLSCSKKTEKGNGRYAHVYFHAQNMSILVTFLSGICPSGSSVQGRLNYVLRLRYDSVDFCPDTYRHEAFFFFHNKRWYFSAQHSYKWWVMDTIVTASQGSPHSQFLRATAICTWNTSQFSSPLSLHKI